MTAARGTPGHVGSVRVLDADCDLAEVLDDQQLEEARCALVAPAITLAKGDWSPRQGTIAVDAQIGVLVTKGILCREVMIGDSVCAELVGPGDLLRPWEGTAAGSLVSCDVHWHVLEDAQLAILGSRFATVAARWPALTSALVGRAINRSHALALSATISCSTGLEARLMMLFWHLADRWGRVRPDGVLVPIRMTHALIGRLISARRPSVSTALKQLERDGQITRLPGGGWLLAGDPPHALPGQPVTRPDHPLKTPSSHGDRRRDAREHAKAVRMNAKVTRVPAATKAAPARSRDLSNIAGVDGPSQASRRPAA